ncbi:MAG TPA: AAA family ATPase [Xanthobacteraceae bacterium]|nr:AAA family ATPase [Xanthobacteraceae bacterium]
MQRILVIGSSGTGKSTLARKIAPKLGLPVIHLDQEYWQPGWVATEPAAWKARVERLVAREAWVMDGNYSGTFAIRVPRADAIVWLDLPRHIYFPRAVWRIVQSYGRVRPDLAPGCPEKVDLEFLFKWVWTYPTRSRPRTLSLIESLRGRIPVVVLRTPRQVRAFVEGLPATLVSRHAEAA